ncbi:hypothetical protein ES703_91322 [subsurface metagenome]
MLPLRISARLPTGGVNNSSRNEFAVISSAGISDLPNIFISFFAALLMAMSDAYLGSLIPVWIVQSAGRVISRCSSNPPSSSR